MAVRMPCTDEGTTAAHPSVQSERACQRNRLLVGWWRQSADEPQASPRPASRGAFLAERDAQKSAASDRDPGRDQWQSGHFVVGRGQAGRVISLTLSAGGIQEIYALLNPEKLAYLQKQLSGLVEPSF